MQIQGIDKYTNESTKQIHLSGSRAGPASISIKQKEPKPKVVLGDKYKYNANPYAQIQMQIQHRSIK